MTLPKSGPQCAQRRQKHMSIGPQRSPRTPPPPERPIWREAACIEFSAQRQIQVDIVLESSRSETLAVEAAEAAEVDDDLSRIKQLCQKRLRLAALSRITPCKEFQCMRRDGTLRSLLICRFSSTTSCRSFAPETGCWSKASNSGETCSPSWLLRHGCQHSTQNNRVLIGCWGMLGSRLSRTFSCNFGHVLEILLSHSD